uniref:Uncharacterized protein n=1 Tax=Picea sitchensis TaxID=3332 RepID=A9NQL8_PICSI|nr:unknown [Picea sitchensis]
MVCQRFLKQENLIVEVPPCCRIMAVPNDLYVRITHQTYYVANNHLLPWHRYHQLLHHLAQRGNC